MFILIKLTLDTIFIKVKKSARAAQLSQNNQKKIIKLLYPLLLRRPQEPQKMRQYPLDSNLEI